LIIFAILIINLPMLSIIALCIVLLGESTGIKEKLGIDIVLFFLVVDVVLLNPVYRYFKRIYLKWADKEIDVETKE